MWPFCCSASRVIRPQRRRADAWPTGCSLSAPAKSSLLPSAGHQPSAMARSARPGARRYQSWRSTATSLTARNWPISWAAHTWSAASTAKASSGSAIRKMWSPPSPPRPWPWRPIRSVSTSTACRALCERSRVSRTSSGPSNPAWSCPSPLFQSATPATTRRSLRPCR